MKTPSTALTRPSSLVRRRERHGRRADVHREHVGEAAHRERDRRQPEPPREAEHDHARAEGRRRRAAACVRRARRADGARSRMPATSAPTATMLRSTPRPNGPVWRIDFAKSGSSATAPPNSTANRSSVIAPRITGRRPDEADAREERLQTGTARGLRVAPPPAACTGRRTSDESDEQPGGRRRRPPPAAARTGARRAPARRSSPPGPRSSGARARRSRRSAGTSSGVSERPAGFPSAPIAPVSASESEELPELVCAAERDGEQKPDDHCVSEARRRSRRRRAAAGRRAGPPAARAAAPARTRRARSGRGRRRCAWIEYTCHPIATWAICIASRSRASTSTAGGSRRGAVRAGARARSGTLPSQELLSSFRAAA